MSAHDEPWSELTDLGTVSLTDPKTGEDAVQLALRILAATGQPLLPRQIVEKLARWSLDITAVALDRLLSAAVNAHPGLSRDDFGRWRLPPG